MNPSPQVEFGPQRAVQISAIVVVNIIWWMVMIAAIGLGATHVGRCPVQPYIPIYLIVLGATSLLSLSVTYTKSVWGDGIVFILSSTCMSFLHLFSFGWFIAGTCWVYPVYPPNYTPGAAPYCQKTTYQFAFIITTVVWVTMTLIFVCGFCFALLTCCKTVFARRRLIPNRGTFYGAFSEEPTAGDV
ncbi:transmembrane protein 272-like [Micropterus dolomieu]|uniref:transmembrane protein 272-like n=1 Tax=Micropterus dolomieu TaxID=147949 RepID=UPI001E8ED7E9|nr:transmembrane protein 272-like [Micropterus dolomieu]